jgi:hypothetical protein
VCVMAKNPCVLGFIGYNIYIAKCKMQVINCQIYIAKCKIDNAK